MRPACPGMDSDGPLPDPSSAPTRGGEQEGLGEGASPSSCPGAWGQLSSLQEAVPPLGQGADTVTAIPSAQGAGGKNRPRSSPGMRVGPRPGPEGFLKPRTSHQLTVGGSVTWSYGSPALFPDPVSLTNKPKWIPMSLFEASHPPAVTAGLAQLSLVALPGETVSPGPWKKTGTWEGLGNPGRVQGPG